MSESDSVTSYNFITSGDSNGTRFTSLSPSDQDVINEISSDSSAELATLPKPRSSQPQPQPQSSSSSRPSSSSQPQPQPQPSSSYQLRSSRPSSSSQPSSSSRPQPLSYNFENHSSENPVELGESDFTFKTLYYDYKMTLEFIAKITRKIPCDKSSIRPFFLNWKSHNKQEPYTLNNMINPDSCWFDRSIRVFKNLKHKNLAEIIGWKRIDNCTDYVRKLLVMSLNPTDTTCYEFYINRMDAIPLHLCDLNKLSKEAIFSIIQQVKNFCEHLQANGYVATVLNDGCFMLSPDFTIRYYRHEHIFKTTSTGYVDLMNRQYRNFVDYFNAQSRSFTASIETIQKKICGRRMELYFGTLISPEEIQKSHAFSTGRNSLVYLTNDEKYMIKIVPMTTTVSDDVTDQYYKDVEEDFYEEVESLKIIDQYNSPDFVVKPVGAFLTSSETLEDFVYLYDIPAYQLVKYNQIWNQSTPCMGVIVTKYFGSDSQTFHNFIVKNPRLEKLANLDLIGYIYKLAATLPIIHLDIHGNNVLVKNGKQKLMTINYNSNSYYWISLPLDYLIIDFGRSEITNNRDITSDFDNMWLRFNRPIAEEFLPPPHQDIEFNRYKKRSRTRALSNSEARVVGSCEIARFLAEQGMTGGCYNVKCSANFAINALKIMYDAWKTNVPNAWKYAHVQNATEEETSYDDFHFVSYDNFKRRISSEITDPMSFFVVKHNNDQFAAIVISRTATTTDDVDFSEYELRFQVPFRMMQRKRPIGSDGASSSQVITISDDEQDSGQAREIVSEFTKFVDNEYDKDLLKYSTGGDFPIVPENLPFTRNYTARVVDMFYGHSLGESLVYDLKTQRVTGTIYKGPVTQAINACGYTSAKALKIMYDAGDDWKSIPIESAADTQVIQEINKFLSTPDSQGVYPFLPVQDYGNNARWLSTPEIFQVLRRLYGIKFSFCGSYDYFQYAIRLILPVADSGSKFYFVVNTETSGKRGIHWAAVVIQCN